MTCCGRLASTRFWRPPAPVNQPIRDWPNLTFLVEVRQAGSYRLRLFYTQAPDYGDARVFFRGNAAGELRGYAPAVRLQSLEMGRFALPQGKQQVVITVYGKEPASKGYLVGIDRIELLTEP